MYQSTMTKFLPSTAHSASVGILPILKQELLLPLDFYGVGLCEECGEAVVKAGWRYNVSRENAQRLYCRKCRKYLELDFNAHSHLPKWVFDRVDSLIVHGVRYAFVPGEVRREARNRDEKVTISIPTVYNIVQKSNDLLEDFEKIALSILAVKDPPSKVWIIDERFYRLTKKKTKGRQTQIQKYMNTSGKSNLSEEVKKPKRKKRKGRFMYGICVIEQKSGNCFSAVISKKRDKRAALKALALAAERTGYTPKEIRCDAHKPSSWAARLLFPGAVLVSRSKKEKVECINEIECWFSGVARAISKSRFRTNKALDSALNLYRYHRNLLEVYKSGPYIGKTPAEVLGICLPPEIKDEQDFKFLKLLTSARKFLNFVRAFQAKRWLVSS
jgi:hypothetical protein